MASKVFLFDNDIWLYCSDVTLEQGVYKGDVINGNYWIEIDTVANKVRHQYSIHKATLVWACDPFKNLFDYNSVIADARERYAAGEPADYELKPDPVYENDKEDEIPF